MRCCEVVKKERISEVASAELEWRRGYDWRDAAVTVAIR